VLDGGQDLQKEAASGGDDVPADASAANLQGNSEAVVQRVQTQRSRATWVRRCDLPQANGTDRPLGMPALEAHLGQLAGATLWTAISAQDLLDCRDGSRAGRGAVEAVRARTFDRQDGRYGSLGEADIQGCVDHRDPTWRWDLVRLRLDDRAVLHLSRPGRKARIVDTDGQVVHAETGTPQGGTGAPVLAQVSLP